jgi:crotonobetainyl-CoA:carnitine CoA-transferase CaiB-like acyl-CoA transferase
VRPLEGVRVVALEHAVAAPLCSRHLADLGADVIKIERAEGDFARNYDSYVHGQSSHFVWLNRGKRSLTLDVKHAEGRRVLERLVGGADVLLQNLAPGATARLGLSHEALLPAHPSLVVCDISGYGESGPFAQKKAYDLLIQAESGLISVTGSPEQPSRVGISIADIATGMYAVTGILAALVRRGRTGYGANVKVAMLDALAEWMSQPMLRMAHTGSPPPRSAGAHPAIAPYGPHRTGDGQVMFGIQNEREWAVFCARVLRMPEVRTDARFATVNARRDNRPALTALMEDVFATMTSMEVVAVLDEAGIANGRLNDAQAVLEHVQLSGRDRWRTVGSEHGPVRALLPPFMFADTDAVMGDVPAIGQHNDEVLAELGYEPTDIAALHSAGAV